MSKKIRPRQIWTDKDTMTSFRILRVHDVPLNSSGTDVEVYQLNGDRRYVLKDERRMILTYCFLSDKGY